MALFGGGVEAARLLVSVGTQGAEQTARTLSGLGRSVQSVGSQISGAGRQLSALSLPILALGAAVISVGRDFDDSLRKIVGLTNVTADEIGGIREAILGLSGEVGKTPIELADAFYFLASAGFTGTEALDVLAVTAKASAAGLGETALVAQVVGSAVNAYGKENLTAARATDILIAAVGEGTAEAPEFAASLGTVMSSAALMGVSFDETTAAVAGMTIAGIDAAEASTALNRVLLSLLDPGKEAKATLKELGLSAEGLREQIREKGLLSVLRTLEKRFGGNTDAIVSVFDETRALKGVLSLLGLDAAQLDAIFASTAAEIPRTEQAFAETEGPGREMDRTMADIQSTLIGLSTTVLPMVVEVLGGLRAGLAEVRKWWDSLEEGTKRNVVTFAALFAAAGPVLLILGALVSAVGLLLSPIGLVIVGVALLAAAFATDFGGIRTTVTGAVGWITENVVPALGQAFDWIVENVLPPLADAFRAVAENVLPILQLAFQTVADVVRDNWPTISSIIGQVAGAVKRGAEVMAAVLKFVMPIIREIAEILFPILGKAAGVLLGWIDTYFKAIGVAGQTLYDVLSGVVKQITRTWDAMVSFFSALPARIGSAVRGMWDGIWLAFRSALNSIIRAWNSLKFSIPSVNLGLLGTFGGFTIGTPNLPYFQKGAWDIPATMAAVIHKGEMVLPAGLAEMFRGMAGPGSRAPGGGVSVVVNIGTFYGTEDNVRRLSESLGRQLRLATIPGS